MLSSMTFCLKMKPGTLELGHCLRALMSTYDTCRMLPERTYRTAYFLGEDIEIEPSHPRHLDISYMFTYCQPHGWIDVFTSPGHGSTSPR